MSSLAHVDDLGRCDQRQDAISGRALMFLALEKLGTYAVEAIEGIWEGSPLSCSMT
jgi:hypothetical protein